MYLLFRLSNVNSDFPLTLGYLNPALNNPALGYTAWLNEGHWNFTMLVQVKACYLFFCHALI